MAPIIPHELLETTRTCDGCQVLRTNKGNQHPLNDKFWPVFIVFRLLKRLQQVCGTYLPHFPETPKTLRSLGCWIGGYHLCMILWLFGGYPHKSWHYPVSVCDAMKQSEGQVGNTQWSPMKWSAKRITGHILIFNFAPENFDATVLVQLVNRPPNIVSDVESEIPSCAGEVPLHLKKIDVWKGECEVKTKTFWQSFANVKKNRAYNIQSRTKIISKKRFQFRARPRWLEAFGPCNPHSYS